MLMLVHSAIVCAVQTLRIHLKQYGVHSQSDQKKAQAQNRHHEKQTKSFAECTVLL